LDIRKNFFTERVIGQALEQAAQGSGGLIFPGGVRKTWRYGMSRHGLAGMVVVG